MLQFNFRTHGHSFQSSSHIHSDNWLDWVSCFFMLAFEIYAANSKSKRCKSSGNGAPYSCRQRYAWPMVLQIWAYLWFIGLNTFCYPSLIWKEWDIKKRKTNLILTKRLFNERHLYRESDFCKPNMDNIL